jgi:arylsulfatase A-like enzyme
VGETTLSPGETSLHSVLNSNGYSTSLIGKWHLSRDENQPGNMGVDYFAGILGGGVGNYFSWNLLENGSLKRESEYTTTKFTDLAIDWISDQTNPWFCWMAYNASHNPIHLPPDHMHSFGNLSEDPVSVENDELSYFLAMTESLDYDMGRLIENIPGEQKENTIVIFVGDNGTSRNVIQSPYNRDKRKGSLYEGGIRVPMVVAGPGINRRNESESGMFHVVDLFKTISGLAKANIEDLGDGFDFSSILQNSGDSPRTINFSESQGTPGPYRYAIRNDDYKIIVTNNNESNFEMYHLKSDPFENTDLAKEEMSLEQITIKQELIHQADSLKQ